MSYSIYWVPSPKYTAGHPAPLIALVHHRMVGTLASTDTTFTTGARVASTNFGIGLACGKTGHPAGAHIHQYVALGNQAWGNGNWDVSGKWDDSYPTATLNSRTISIEHHDNGGAVLGSGKKGVVPEAVIVASVWLDGVLLRGDLTEMKVAGIKFNPSYEVAIAKELRAIPVDVNHIIDHNYVAGRLKPYCWKPWSDDKIGFPQARFISELSSVRAPVVEVEMDSFNVATGKKLSVPTGTVLYISTEKARGATEAVRADARNIILSSARELPLVGTFVDNVRVVAYQGAGWSVPHSFYARSDVGTIVTAPAIVDAALVKRAETAEAALAIAKTSLAEANLQVGRLTGNIIKKDTAVAAYPAG